MEYGDNRRRSSGQKGGRGGPSLSSSRGRGRRSYLSSEDVHENESVTEPMTQSNASEQLRSDLDIFPRKGFDNRRGRRRYERRGRDSGIWRIVNEPVHKSDSNQLSEGTSLQMPYSGHRRPVGTVQEEERGIDSARQREMRENTNKPQLVQELELMLTTDKIECMIFYDNMDRNAPMWSCVSCYLIFHLSCVRKWARAPTSSDISVSATGKANWRCPGYQVVQLSTFNELQYQCFCGQVRESTLDHDITHCCGGPCRKPVDKSKNGYCKHTCTLQCHRGPCPPCTALAPPQPCPREESIATRVAPNKERMHEAVARNVADCCLVVAMCVHRHAKKAHVSRAVSCLKRRDVFLSFES